MTVDSEYSSTMFVCVRMETYNAHVRIQISSKYTHIGNVRISIVFIFYADLLYMTHTDTQTYVCSRVCAH